MASVHLLNQPVVLDLGSGLTKGGYAGTPEPSALIGTVTGTPRLPKVLPTSSGGDAVSFTSSSRDSARIDLNSSSALAPKSSSSLSSAPHLVGADLLRMSGVLTLHHPLHRGEVRDWHAAEHVWRHVAHDLLSVTPGEHPYLITEAILNPKPNREKLAQFFFESLSAPALHIAYPPALSLFASGRTSGLVLDVGDTVSAAVPVAQGHCDVHAMQRIDIAGRDVTDRMVTLLRKSGASLFSTSSEWQAVRRLKEKLAYVAVNPADEETKAALPSQSNDHSTAREFQLPDGNVVRVGPERFRAPEILFRPDIVGREFGGITRMAAQAIEGVDIGLRRSLYSTIILAVRYLLSSSNVMLSAIEI